MSDNVTKAERRLARIQANDTDRLQRKAVTDAARIGWKLQQRVLSAYQRGRRKMILQTVRREILSAKDLLTEVMLESYLTGVERARDSANIQLSTVAKAVKSLRRGSRLTTDQIEELRDKYESDAIGVLTGLSKVVESRMMVAMARVTQERMHVKDGIKQIREAFQASNITPRNSFQFETIFRTQTLLAYSTAKWDEDHDPVIDEILWGYKYVTVGDDRVRPEHEGMDGVTLPKDDPFWNENFPPNGWSCRCQVIEIFEEREKVKPPKRYEATDDDGEPIIVTPGADEGWGFNPGQVFGVSG